MKLTYKQAIRPFARGPPLRLVQSHFAELFIRRQQNLLMNFCYSDERRWRNINKSTVPAEIQRWKDIDFRKAEIKVKKLQRRIASAWANKNFKTVDTLQHKLIHSFSAKALAVKTVVDNKGSRTPGVDGVIWSDLRQKLDAIYQLRRRGYKPMPLRRVYVPKKDGTLRPLSIPTMRDRAMQMLCKMALEPIAEATADKRSFAYLSGRGAREAIICLKVTLRDNPQFRWVMKADVAGCFDNIDHSWLLEHIPMDRKILCRFLKCGYIEDSTFYPTERGVPQGGCISSVLCNMTLDGLEGLLKQQFGLSVCMIRYADDIIIIGESREILVQAVTPVIESFLAERGLALSKKKTGYYPVKAGVSFLVWKTYRDRDRVISEPSNIAVNRLMNEIESIAALAIDYHAQCEKVSSKIRGWLNYYRGIAPRLSLNEVEFYIAQSLLHMQDVELLAGEIQSIFSELLDTL